MCSLVIKLVVLTPASGVVSWWVHYRWGQCHLRLEHTTNVFYST